MNLTVHNVATMLNVSERTVYRWIDRGQIPVYKINDQYRFNRAELLEWATAQKLHVSPEFFREADADDRGAFKLSDALQAGGIFYRVDGTDKTTALKAVVELLRLPDDVDRGWLFEMLLARESLGSTAVGDGLAIPHVRHPIVLHTPNPLVTLCFLERPIEFGALDGKPVTTLFTLVSPSVRAHLHVLSLLAYALRDAGVKGVVGRQASREEIMAELRRVEATLPQAGPAPAGGRE